MPKKIINDIKPPKRSIRNVPIPDNRRSKEIVDDMVKINVKGDKSDTVSKKKSSENGEPFFSYSSDVDNSIVYDYSNDNSIPQDNSGSRRNFVSSLPKIILWTVALISCITLMLSFFSLFSGATVKITPQQKKFPIEGEFIASKNPSSQELKYELIQLTQNGSKEVKATADQKLETKSSGQIIVFNNYSEEPQSLIKNTRFETPEGLIYRVDKNITIPGRTVSGTSTIPGSIKITVYADASGEKYNIDLTDFTIPGLKGSQKYSSIFARSSTKMTGGFSGIVKKVDATDELSAFSDIENSLKTSLLKEMTAQIPTDFIFYNDGVFFDFEKMPQSDASSSNVILNEKGTVYGIIFSKSALNKFLVNQAVANASGTPIQIGNLDKLNFSILNKDSFDPKNDTSFKFTLKGEITAVWSVDLQKLKTVLAGKSKKDLFSILSDFPAVEKAESFITPIWKNFYPENPEKIKIEQIITING